MINTAVGSWQGVKIWSVMPAGTSSEGPKGCTGGSIAMNNTAVGSWQEVNIWSVMPAGTSSNGPKGCTDG